MMVEKKVKTADQNADQNAIIADQSAIIADLKTVKQMWDVIVIGAGPAGSMVAHSVAAQSASVLLLDKTKFPREKVCGCCISQTAYAALEAAGIESIISSSDATHINKLKLYDRHSRAELAIPPANALSRGSFDSALLANAIKSGAQFLGESTGTVTDVHDDYVSVQVIDASSEFTLSARVVVVADGLAGRSLRNHPDFSAQTSTSAKFGTGAILPQCPSFVQEGTIHMACTSNGYVGMVKLEQGKLDIAAALDRTYSLEHSGISQAVSSILKECGISLDLNQHDLKWHGTSQLTKRRKTIAGKRIFVVGDSCSYSEPFTGEGMSWALWSGLALTPLVVDSISNWRAPLIDEWSKIHTLLIQRRQNRSMTISAFLQNGCLRQAALKLFERLPGLASPLLKRFEKEHMLADFAHIKKSERITAW